MAKRKTTTSSTANTPAADPVATPNITTPADPAPNGAPRVSRSETKGSGTGVAPKKSTTKIPTQDEIAKRAYEIYAGRGYSDGDPTADWLEAERQLRAGI